MLSRHILKFSSDINRQHRDYSNCGSNFACLCPICKKKRHHFTATSTCISLFLCQDNSLCILDYAAILAPGRAGIPGELWTGPRETSRRRHTRGFYTTRVMISPRRENASGWIRHVAQRRSGFTQQTISCSPVWLGVCTRCSFRLFQ